MLPALAVGGSASMPMRCERRLAARAAGLSAGLPVAHWRLLDTGTVLGSIMAWRNAAPKILTIPGRYTGSADIRTVAAASRRTPKWTWGRENYALRAPHDGLRFRGAERPGNRPRNGVRVSVLAYFTAPVCHGCLAQPCMSGAPRTAVILPFTVQDPVIRGAVRRRPPPAVVLPGPLQRPRRTVAQTPPPKPQTLERRASIHARPRFAADIAWWRWPGTRIGSPPESMPSVGMPDMGGCVGQP